MGVEERSCYTADVTRTFPVAGAFTDAQRQVHDLVEKSHRAGLAALAPGKPYSDFHFACMEEIAKGLHDWDLLPVSVDEALSPSASSTAVGWCAVWATTWAWTCMTARTRTTRTTRARCWRKTWC